MSSDEFEEICEEIIAEVAEDFQRDVVNPGIETGLFEYRKCDHVFGCYTGRCLRGCGETRTPIFNTKTI